MAGVLKAALMVLGAVCVLLLAGGFPLMGAPEVYRGGAMLAAGGLAGALCAWGGWRMAKGRRAYFIVGLLGTFFAAAGAVVIYMFGAQAVANARIGGVMWFGAVGMFCIAAVGLIFVGVFGYLAWRAMTRRLWLAAAHWALVLMVAGAFMDNAWEVEIRVPLVPSGKEISEVVIDGETRPLGFTLQMEKFDESYYPGAGYTLYRKVDGAWRACGKPEVQGDELVLDGRRWKVADLRGTEKEPTPHWDGWCPEETYTLLRLAGSQWKIAGKPVRRGDSLVLGEASWPLADMRYSESMNRPCLFINNDGERAMIIQDPPNERLSQDPPTVRDYCATCRVTTDHRGNKESRTVDIRVNEPLSCKGWVVYLMDRRVMGDTVLVSLSFRHAPGRLPMLGGMVCLIISTACWCWKRKEEEVAA